MFKIGDKVRFIGESTDFFKRGDTGVVLYMYSHSGQCVLAVRLSTLCVLHGFGSAFELVLSKQQLADNKSFWESVAE